MFNPFFWKTEEEIKKMVEPTKEEVNFIVDYIKKYHELKFSDLPSRKLARYLYENATIYLDRKYERFLEYCRLEEESSRRLSSNIGEGWDANPEISLEIAKGSKPL